MDFATITDTDRATVALTPVEKLKNRTMNELVSVNLTVLTEPC